LARRPSGARGTAKELGTFLGSVHIRAVADVYQNIAKNSDKLDRGNVAEFDDFLRWASEPGRRREEFEAVFDYVAARVAATARPVLPMPALDLSSLTFSAVVGLDRYQGEVERVNAFVQLLGEKGLVAKRDPAAGG
jgi:hypothetical protein